MRFLSPRTWKGGAIFFFYSPGRCLKSWLLPRLMKEHHLWPTAFSPLVTGSGCQCPNTQVPLPLPTRVWTCAQPVCHHLRVGDKGRAHGMPWHLSACVARDSIESLHSLCFSCQKLALLEPSEYCTPCTQCGLDWRGVAGSMLCGQAVLTLVSL